LLPAIDWTRPWYQPFAASASVLSHEDLREGLNAVAGALRNARGQPLRFVPQSSLPDGTAYESHIHASGQVPTRDNLHDAFNALIWLHFPETKRLLNRLQAEAIARDGVQQMRGGLRDAATLFDENAILFLTEDDTLFDALKGFDWRELFITRRVSWRGVCGVMPFGHALLEKLVHPYKAVTAHAWRVIAPPSMPMHELDAMLAADLAEAAEAGRFAGGRSFSPLPVMGIPGWCDGNADPAFYEDVTVFRPGRRPPQPSIR